MAAVFNIYRAANVVRNHTTWSGRGLLADEEISPGPRSPCCFVLWIWARTRRPGTLDLPRLYGVTNGDALPLRC